ncbi:MAG: hypothetical protein ACI4NE_08375 [Succinivibrio sp.]
MDSGALNSAGHDADFFNHSEFKKIFEKLDDVVKTATNGDIHLVFDSNKKMVLYVTRYNSVLNSISLSGDNPVNLIREIARGL